MELSTLGLIFVLIIAVVILMDEPRVTHWLLPWNPRSTTKPKTLLEILGDPHATQETQETDKGKNETHPQATTYTEAIARMQKRDQTRSHSTASRRDPRKVRR